MNRIPYKKDWIASTGIARGMLGTEIEQRIPTIKEYTETFDCSRGVVQNALESLQQSGAIVLSKRGKNGTFLAEKNEEVLFQNAGLQFITGSMPAPLSIHLAGLATAICQAMNRCRAPFTFAFVQGAKNRVNALLREVYDFVVVTRSAAQEHIKEHQELEIAFSLQGCEYSYPNTLYINKPGLLELSDGMTIAADPSSTDQWELTKLVTKGKNIRILEMPYISCNHAFLSGAVDSVIMQGELGSTQPNLNTLFYTGDGRISSADISAIPIAEERSAELMQPVILINKKNYGIGGILKNYLLGELVAHIQKMVIDYKMAPQFY